MPLLTPEIEKTLRTNNRKTNNSKLLPVVRLFVPYTICSWLLCSMTEEGLGYGMADLGSPEWGYVNLDELAEVEIDVQGLTLRVERDDTFIPMFPMRVHEHVARSQGRMLVNTDLLKQAAILINAS